MRRILYLRDGICKQDNAELNAPAVAFGMLQRSLHFDVENVHKSRRPNRFRASRGEVRSPVARLQNAHDGLFDPVRFERQAKGIAKHHRRAQNGTDRIG